MSQFLSALESAELVEHSGVPRKALKTLLVGNGLCPGSRVLVVGGTNVAFLRCLDGLGLLVTGFESNASRLAQLRRTEPLLDFRGGAPRETAYLPEHAFDLVLVRDHPAYNGSLAALEPLRTTSDLLAALRPNGALAVLDSSQSPSVPGVRRHALNCFASHLAVFPGNARHETTSDGPVLKLWSRGMAPPSTPFWIAQHQINGNLLPRIAWRRLGELAAEHLTGECCAADERDHKRAA